MKTVFKFIIFVTAIILLGCAFFYTKEFLIAPTNSSSKVCFKNNCFFVELAKTDTEREKGLMYRNKLDENKGMLFIFGKEDIYSFWMKNTLIPLDMIWIDSNSKVVFISKNTKPCRSLICPTINPGVKAQYVLEINAGMAEKIGLEVGSVLSITY